MVSDERRNDKRRDCTGAAGPGGNARQSTAGHPLSLRQRLEPPDLRQRAGDPTLLAALLRFLEAHEPDLLAIADELDVKPDALVTARREFEQ